MKIRTILWIIFLAIASIQSVYTQDYGNTTGQEYGDPVYRILDFYGYNYNHTGIYSGINSGHNKRVRQALGSDYTTHEAYLSTDFTDYGTGYYGAYTLSNITISFVGRRNINTTAREIVDAAIPYPGDYINPLPVCIEYYGFTFDGTITDISNIRCDGVVEYCYERNGFRVWRNQDYSDSEWSIVSYPDNHNDRPDADRDPDFEASPWAQRGAPCGTGPNPEDGCDYASSDTRMNRAAVVNLPTYQFSAVYGNGYTDVTVKATDESGIHYIGYKKPGDTVWSYSPTQAQDPYYDNYSYTFRVNQSGSFYAFAVDNGGNYPSTVSGYQVIVYTTPTVPVLSLPANGATGISVNPTLSWGSSAGASSYCLQVSENSGFTTFVYNQSGLTATAQAVTGLANNKLYYWRVNATNLGGTSSYSTASNFTTIVSVPSTPVLTSPLQNSINIELEPTLYWSSVADAEFYQLLVYKIIDSTPNLIYEFDGYSETSKKLSPLNYDSQYLWSVRAANDGGYSPYAEEFYFTTIKNTAIEELGSSLPTEYNLAQNYPNPFNPSTTIEFSIVERTHVSLSVFNSLGQEVEKLVDQNLSQGKYSVIWEPFNIPSGTYFYTIKTQNFNDTKRLYLLK